MVKITVTVLQHNTICSNQC